MPTKGLKAEESLELPTTTPAPPPPAGAHAAYPAVPPLTDKPQSPPMAAAAGVKPEADGIAAVRIPPQVQTATAAPGAPGQDKVVVYIQHPADDLGQNPDRCACTTGWLLFGLGWAFWPLWFAGALLPLCDKRASPTARANNRRAAIGSAVLGGVALAMFIIIVVVAVTSAQAWYNNYVNAVYSDLHGMNGMNGTSPYGHHYNATLP